MAANCFVIGSGLMVPVLIQNLQKFGMNIRVGGVIPAQLAVLNQTFGVQTMQLDVSNSDQLRAALQDASIAISMIPASMHHLVLEACIDTQTNLVTSSYVSPEVKALEQKAIEAGVTLIPQMGVDPGIDHMSVLKQVRQIHQKGGKIQSFISLCGAIPDPKSSDSPISYKFSWAPYTSLLSSVRPAQFKEENQQRKIQGKNLMWNTKQSSLEIGKSLEFFPNGNSLNYIEKYQIPQAETFIRGSFRYKHFVQVIKGFVIFGFFDQEPYDFGQIKTWIQLISHLAFSQNPESPQIPEIPGIQREISLKISSKLHGSDLQSITNTIQSMVQLNLLSDTPLNGQSLYQCFINQILDKCQYLPGEQDMVLMEHTYVVDYDGRKVQLKSRLIEKGVVSETSAVSRLVSGPASIAAKFIIENNPRPGILYPTDPSITNQLFSSLQQEFNIRFEEFETPLN